MRKLTLVFVLFFTVLNSCEFFEQGNNEAWIAKYKNHYLAKVDLKSIYKEGLSEKDSIALANDFIENWLKDKILLEESKNILSEEDLLNIEVKINQYKEDLIGAYIQDNLLGDKNINKISEEAIRSYYDEYKNNFPLKNTVVDYKYIVVPNEESSEIKKLFRASDFDSIIKIAEQNNYIYDIQPIHWIELSKLNRFPDIDEIKTYLLRKGQILSTEKNNKTSIVYISDYKKSKDISPYNYIKPQLKKIILNKRKLNLLSKLKNDLYEKAVVNEEIKRK